MGTTISTSSIITTYLCGQNQGMNYLLLYVKSTRAVDPKWKSYRLIESMLT